MALELMPKTEKMWILSSYNLEHMNAFDFIMI